jgi:hypothetical protein
MRQDDKYNCCKKNHNEIEIIIESNEKCKFADQLYFGCYKALFSNIKLKKQPLKRLGT